MNISIIKWLLLALTLQSAVVSAQVISALGTINEIMQDDGYIVIDNNRFVFELSEIRITYQGRPMRSSFLSSGLRVRYSTHKDGSISELVLVGPARILEQIDAQ